MPKQTSGQTRAKPSETTRQMKESELTEEERQRFLHTANYCLRHFPMFWTPGVPRQENDQTGLRRWIFPIFLWYPTGYEGYLGDLLYDGKQFTELTDRTVMEERANQIAADPERTRKWNEYRTATLPAGEG